MARKKLIQGWDWVKTERVGTAERKPIPDTSDEIVAVAPRPSAGAGLASVAITAGLLVGAVMFMRNRPKPQPVEQPTVAQSSPAAPPLVLMLPEGQDDLLRLSKHALGWVRFAPHESDERLAPAIWYAAWPRVVYPGLPREGEHSSVMRARALISSLLAVARAQHAAELALEDAQRRAAANDAPEDAPRSVPANEHDATEPEPEVQPEPEDDEADAEEPKNMRNLISGRPLPGRLYRVHPEIAPYGIEAVAALALRHVGNVLGMAEGRSPDEADEWACELADDPDARSAYVDLIAASWWNKARLDPVRPKSLIWCPPLALDGLLEDQRRIELDPTPWSNGATRNDPPPPHWQPQWLEHARVVT